MENIMIKIDNVTKEYRLGTIGGGTLQGDIQSWWATIHGREDPNSKIGEVHHGSNDRFLALDGVSFDVKKGERVGIIGHNGAGKSTLLKLLSRVTAPSSGEIGLNGRIASMLEVGTGFHGELTGRQNIYMNGAILGMKKAEIDSKINDIIAFSECEKFIDTPVKRYSSGMYVKLAFAVAAHLDAEIMIMDEVLAVGDMAFQKKCLDKMSEVSKKDGRTILYVSHNMNTIRQLCERCVVLDHGKVIYDGDVEEAISIYSGYNSKLLGVDIDLANCRMEHLPEKIQAKIRRVSLLDKGDAIYEYKEALKFSILLDSYTDIKSISLRVEIRSVDDIPVAAAVLDNIGSLSNGQTEQYCVTIPDLCLVPELYKVLLVIYDADRFGNFEDIDAVWPAFNFEVVDTTGKMQIKWNRRNWGAIRLEAASVKRMEL